MVSSDRTGDRSPPDRKIGACQLTASSVGAGPAGLAASEALSNRQIDHVILEQDRVGRGWRTQRWDLPRLNNPGCSNTMLGPNQATPISLPPMSSPGRTGSPHSGGENVPRTPRLSRARPDRVLQLQRDARPFRSHLGDSAPTTSEVTQALPIRVGIPQRGVSLPGSGGSRSAQVLWQQPWRVSGAQEPIHRDAAAPG